MDDFVADAIISQLLLLDAVDPTKEIRLFVNCPGGSIRYLTINCFAVLRCRVLGAFGCIYNCGCVMSLNRGLQACTGRCGVASWLSNPEDLVQRNWGP